MTAGSGAAGTNGFLFCDLRGYTAFVEARGDQAAADLLATYRALVRAAIATHAGAEIKTEGDSVYVVFPAASAAVEAGLEIVAAAAEASTRDAPIRVGVGVHAGETVATTEGLVGGAVNIAARVCAKAQAGEVLVTDTVRALTRTYLPVPLHEPWHPAAQGHRRGHPALPGRGRPSAGPGWPASSEPGAAGHRPRRARRRPPRRDRRLCPQPAAGLPDPPGLDQGCRGQDRSGPQLRRGGLPGGPAAGGVWVANIDDQTRIDPTAVQGLPGGPMTQRDHPIPSSAPSGCSSMARTCSTRSGRGKGRAGAGGDARRSAAGGDPGRRPDRDRVRRPARSGPARDADRVRADGPPQRPDSADSLIDRLVADAIGTGGTPDAAHGRGRDPRGDQRHRARPGGPSSRRPHGRRGLAHAALRPAGPERPGDGRPTGATTAGPPGTATARRRGPATLATRPRRHQEDRQPDAPARLTAARPGPVPARMPP